MLTTNPTPQQRAAINAFMIQVIQSARTIRRQRQRQAEREAQQARVEVA